VLRVCGCYLFRRTTAKIRVRQATIALGAESVADRQLRRRCRRRRSTVPACCAALAGQPGACGGTGKRSSSSVKLTGGLVLGGRNSASEPQCVTPVRMEITRDE
jgi:hypothetical protein